MTTKLTVTERTYSRDNHDFALCCGAEPGTGWIAWSAYEAAGSRAFARHFGGDCLGPVTPLGQEGQTQSNPVCLPDDDGRTHFVWLEKSLSMTSYRVCERSHAGAELSPARSLYALPDGAIPNTPRAAIDHDGNIWIAWAQAETGQNTVRLLRLGGHGSVNAWTVTAGASRDYRPALCPLADNGILLAWDAYADGSYNVFGCVADASGPGEPMVISNAPEWENRATVCGDVEGQVWCAWVHCADAIWKDSVMHQQYSVRGARFDGRCWHALSSNRDEPELTPLHYGLLTDFDRKPPALGHQGRRLHPMLKAARDGAVWLLYESKADDAAQTLDSRGRLLGMRCAGETWTDPLNVAEGLVHYELPHNNTIEDWTVLAARNIDAGNSDIDVDEIVLEQTELNENLAPVPAESRSVDLTHWHQIKLPASGFADHAGEEARLRGPSQGRYRLIWGDFHVHSVGSVECEGELDELAHYARDKSCIQALTLSDNDHFWNHAVRGNQRWLSDVEWDQNLANAKVMNASGDFAVFPGYEQTIGANTLDIGRRLLRNHTSVMGADDDMKRDLLHFERRTREALADGRRFSCKDMVECVHWAREKGYYPLPHAHVNWWRLVDPTVQTCCDVTAAWMRNIECFDIYHTYLNQGLKFGFTGSSDSHYRNPGLGGALTGLWVTDVSRPAILDALRARRVYATAGQRILIEFAVNDTFMGAELVVTDDPVLHWRVAAEPDEDYTLRILRDGHPAHELQFKGETSGSFTDEYLLSHRPGQHYYYLEIRSSQPIPDYRSNAAHALGGRAWSTPVWLETADWMVS